MLIENLQIDSQVDSIINAVFPYDGKNLEFHRASFYNYLVPESAPIGVFMSGGQSQVVLVDEDNSTYEAYVYWYHKHEGPKMFILQTLELEESDEEEWWVR